MLIRYACISFNVVLITKYVITFNGLTFSTESNRSNIADVNKLFLDSLAEYSLINKSKELFEISNLFRLSS